MNILPSNTIANGKIARFQSFRVCISMANHTANPANPSPVHPQTTGHISKALISVHCSSTLDPSITGPDLGDVVIFWKKNSEFSPENGWLEYEDVSFWGRLTAYFQGLRLLVLGSVPPCWLVHKCYKTIPKQTNKKTCKTPTPSHLASTIGAKLHTLASSSEATYLFATT